MSSDHVDVKTAAAIARAGLTRADRPSAPPPKTDRCQRCGAAFRWERSRVGEGWVMRLVSGGKGCDCGYGLRGGEPSGPLPPLESGLDRG